MVERSPFTLKSPRVISFTISNRIVSEAFIVNVLIRWLITSLAVGVAIWLVPGYTIIGGDPWVAMLVSGAILAVLNWSIKPILQILSLPVTVLTLGIFYLVVNAFIIEFTSWLSTSVFGIGFTISGFAAAFFGAIIVSIVTAILNAVTGARA